MKRDIHMKRFLCFLTALFLVFSMLPAVSFAADIRTVYLDPTNGSDSNDGLTQANPVHSVEKAYSSLSGAAEGRIILLSTLTLTDSTYFPDCDIPVTVTGAGISSAKSIFLGGDTTFENIILNLAAQNNTTYISSEGHNLTMGIGITCTNSSNYRFCLTTRYGEGSMDGAVLTVKSGAWRSIFVGGYTQATTGNATLIMTGGDVNNMVAPSYSGNVTGNVTMHISGMTGGGSICCAPNQTGTVTGDVNITLGGGITGKLRIKRLYNNATVNGTATVTIDGDCSGLTEIAHVGSGEGAITKTRLVLKSGKLDLTPCTFDEVAIEIPQGKTFTLDTCRIAATTVNSAGTLLFSGNASLSAAAITGTLNCDISGTALESHAYVTAPAGSAVTFPLVTGVTENNGVWQNTGAFDTENFKGLVLTTTADNVTIELYSGFSTDAANLMSPVFIDGRDRYYAVTSGNSYYCISKPTTGNSRYILHKTFYITAQEAQTKTVVDMTPGVRSTDGWDTAEAVCNFTDEVLTKAFPSDASLWPQYADAFTTPAFREGRTDHKQTTQPELEAFLAELDDPDDHIYVYNLGQTAMGPFNIPLVIVTSVDLSEAETLEEAAALIRADGEANNKVTVHYQGQIHGNEPAAGEAALGMIKLLDGTYGDSLVDSLNIYVIPRLNPYGAYKSKRVTWTDPSTYLDPNRDFMNLETSETLLRMRAFNLFDPDVVFDNHEYQFNLESTAITKRDMMVCTHILPTYSQTYKDAAIGLAYAAFGQLEEDDLTYTWYSSDAKNYSVSSVSAGVGSGNTAFRGTFHILMETLGSNYGTNMYERRVASHVSAVSGILNHLSANSAQLKAVVRAERNAIVENGKIYNEDDVVILKTQANYHPEYNIEGTKVNLRNGGEVAFTFEARMTDTILRSRIAPTAYVIPAGEAYTQRVVEMMDIQGISYQFIPAGSAVMLQQYLGTIDDGTVSEITLTEEKLVAFSEGAYVFCMNQVDSMILALYMEPDVNHSTCSLAQQGIITPEDGVYPIYRYIHDLNAQDFVDYVQAPAAPETLAAVSVTTVGGTGKITGLDADKIYEYRAQSDIEYTTVTAGSAEITGLTVGTYYVRYKETADNPPSLDAQIELNYLLSEYAVYVDAVNGNDAKDAYSAATAAATYGAAKSQLDALMEHVPDGSTGLIRIVGSYTMTNSSSSSLSLQKHDYPLLITGGTLIFKDTVNDRKWLRMGGDTTFDNITLQIGTNSSGYYLCAEGNKLTIGRNVVTTPNGSNYFNIMGSTGVYSNSSYAAQTDITVLSGTWGNVYAGGYVSSVHGDVKAQLSNCSVNRFTGTYNGNIGGDAYYSLRNVTIREGSLYCGNIQKNNVSGDVTLVLGENVNAANVYAGSKTAGNVGGTVTVVADGVDLTATAIHGMANNTTGTVGGLKLVLNSGKLSQVIDSFVTRDGVDVVLGCHQTDSFALPYNIRLDLNGHNVSAIDTNGKTLTVFDSSTDDFDAETYGAIPTGVAYQTPSDYMVITENNRVSFHKYALRITEVTLKTSQAGLTYSCFIAGDQAVKARVAEFGIAMNLYTPADEETIVKDTQSKTHVWRVGSLWQTGDEGQALTGVAVVNIMKAGCTIQENQNRAAIPIYGSAYIKLQDGQYLWSNTEVRTLQQVAEAADGIYDRLNPTQTEALQGLYTSFASVMDAWEIPNIIEHSR